MSLEKDIFQQKFRNEHQKTMINVIYTYNWIVEQLKQVFEKSDLTMQQYNILRILHGSPLPLSTLQIRERMLDKMSDTSRIVDRLVIKGLVRKATCRNDKRLVDIVITLKGKKLLDSLQKEEKNLDKIVGALSNSEAKTLNRLMDKIRMPV